MSGPSAPRLAWADLLRCLACAAVVLLHAAGATLAGESPATLRFLLLDLLDSATRWAVPVFFLLSGALLLDPDRPFSRRGWLRRLGRMALLCLVWSLLYALWDARGAAHLDLEYLLEALILLVRGEVHYHLWFLPALLGLYLLIPPLRALVRGASRRTLWYLVGLWAVFALALPFLCPFLPSGLGRLWLDRLGLFNVGGWAGYFLLGYLLRTCACPPRRAGALYLGGALGWGVTWLGTLLLSRSAGVFQEAFFSYLTPHVCLTAAALFLLARRLDLGQKNPLWTRLSPLTLGVYLLHPALLEVLLHFGFPDPAWNVAWAVPLQAGAVLALTLGAVWLLRRLPKVGPALC